MRMRIRTSIAAALAATAITSIFAAGALAAPANDNFADRQDLGQFLPTTVGGSTVDATSETNEPDHSTVGEGPAASIWYQWIAPASQAIKFDACSNTFPFLRVYTGLSYAAPLIAVGGTGSCSAVVNVTSGVTYKIALDRRFAQGATSLDIHALNPPANDAFAAATSLGGGAT